MRRRAKLRRSTFGYAIAEMAAAMTLIIPVFIVIVYMTYEAVMYMYLKTGVDAAARTQARWLAINFNYFVQQNGNSTANYSTWINSKVRVANCVTTNAQFTNGTLDASGNFVTTAPSTASIGGCSPGISGQGTVAVRVIYPGGSGLATWPAPPLKLFGKQITPSNIPIDAVYVADIEP